MKKGNIGLSSLTGQNRAKWAKWKVFTTFAIVHERPRLRVDLTLGALAHLARARHWQCRGDRFKSDMLHYGRMVLVYGIILFFVVIERFANAVRCLSQGGLHIEAIAT